MPESPGPADLPALTDRCVQCGLCLPHCPTYRLEQSEAESPRGRIAYVRALATGRLAPTAAGDAHLGHCLGCRRCERACPAGVEFGAILDLARSDQRQRQAPDWRQRGIEWLAARPERSARFFGLWRQVGGLLPARRRPLPVPAKGERQAARRDPRQAVVLFGGCAGGVYEAALRERLAALLQALGHVVASPPADCCGALFRHAGAGAEADALAARNRAALAGAERVLSLASGCQEELQRGLSGVLEVEDAICFLARQRERLRGRPTPWSRVALHLPCTQRQLRGSEAALRALLAGIPGLQVVDLPDTGCCGAAGTHMIREAGRARRLRAPLLEAFAAAGAEALLSANLGCRLHLADGGRVNVLHPLEVIVAAYDVPA